MGLGCFDMRSLAAFLLASSIAVASPALALGPVAFGPSLSATGWQDFTFRGRQPSQFSAVNTDTLRVTSDNSGSLIWRPLPADFANGNTAQWRWRVDEAVPPTDLSDRKADDRAIALYFLFADDNSAVGDPPKSLRSAMMSGRALVYVWGGNSAPGTVIRSPSMLGRGQLVVMQPADGPTGQWVSESVDLRADFRRAFGREPGPLMGIGVSADTDNTGAQGDARLADLVID